MSPQDDASLEKGVLKLCRVMNRHAKSPLKKNGWCGLNFNQPCPRPCFHFLLPNISRSPHFAFLGGCYYAAMLRNPMRFTGLDADAIQPSASNSETLLCLFPSTHPDVESEREKNKVEFVFDLRPKFCLTLILSLKASPYVTGS